MCSTERSRFILSQHLAWNVFEDVPSCYWDRFVPESYDIYRSHPGLVLFDHFYSLIAKGQFFEAYQSWDRISEKPDIRVLTNLLRDIPQVLIHSASRAAAIFNDFLAQKNESQEYLPALRFLVACFGPQFPSEIPTVLKGAENAYQLPTIEPLSEEQLKREVARVPKDGIQVEVELPDGTFEQLVEKRALPYTPGFTN